MWHTGEEWVFGKFIVRKRRIEMEKLLEECGRDTWSHIFFPNWIHVSLKTYHKESMVRTWAGNWRREVLGEARGDGMKHGWRGLLVEEDINLVRQEGRRENYSIEILLFRVREKESWQHSDLRVNLGLQAYGFGKAIGRVCWDWLVSFCFKVIDCTINPMSSKVVVWQMYGLVAQNLGWWHSLIYINTNLSP